MTLFRHFGTKENLLGFVIKQAFSGPRTSRQPEIPVDQEGLRTALISLAKAHSRFLAENFAFIRVVIGELHHYTKQERDVVKRIFGPMRQQLIELLQEAAQRNIVVVGDIGMIADLFEGMLFMDVLRRQYHERQTYSADRYFSAAVDMILKQVQVNGSRAPSNTPAKSQLRSTSLGTRRNGRTASAHRNNGRSDRR
jgi:AcrR family transcriptional regulator